MSRSQSEQSSAPGTTHTTHTHAGSAFAGGSKIAYDPRDLDQDAGEEARIGGKMPRLTIMEEVLLLGIKDKQVNGPGILLVVFTLPLPLAVVRAGLTQNYAGLPFLLER